MKDSETVIEADPKEEHDIHMVGILDEIPNQIKSTGRRTGIIWMTSVVLFNSIALMLNTPTW